MSKKKEAAFWSLDKNGADQKKESVPKNEKRDQKDEEEIDKQDGDKRPDL